MGTKAIPNIPALREAATLTYSADDSKRVRTPFGQREAARHLQAYGGDNDAIDWVMNCVKLIVETASSADWHLLDDKGEPLFVPGGPNPTVEGAPEAPLMLTQLLLEPNPYMGLEELIELTLIDYLLVGNAYWMKWRTNDAGQPLALYRLAPPYVKILPGPFGVDGYEYDVPGRGKLVFKPEEIMHFKASNPHSPYYGLGVIQGGARPLDLELALTETQASYFEKRAQPSMVVQSDRRVPKDVFKRLQSQLRAMYGGPRNAGALMVLEAGLKYQSISPSAADAQFENLTKLSRDRILALFRVPGALLGLADATAVAGNPTNDQRIFDQKTMRPLLNKLQAAITKAVTQAWACTFEIDYDYIMPIEERLRLASTFAALPGVKVKEVRDYAKLVPLEGDDEPIGEIILNLPGENVDAGGHPVIADNNLAGEAGRPPNPSNTSAFPANGSIPPGAAARRTSLAAGDNKKAMIEESLAERVARIRDKSFQKAMTQPDGGRTDMHKRITPPDDVLQDDRDAAVDSVTVDLAAELKESIHALERGLLDELEAAYEGKAPGDRLRSKLRKSKAWEAFFAALSGALEAAARRSISSAVVQQSRVGRTPDEDVDYDALVREVVYRAGGARKISANLKDEVAQKVARALETGQTKGDLEAAIREAMDFWRESHAETVAMTEAVHAYNEGVITVAELTGHNAVYVHDGRDHDQPCVDADGSIWDLDKARENRLEHPRCRRGFSPVTI